jgi:putative ABC transport system permease protein
VLAAIGISAVVANAVVRRTREIGVRMALGAGRGDVLRMVLRQGMLLVAIGIVAGLAGALALTRVLRSLLYTVSPTDLVTFAGVPLLLAGIAFVAAYLPARRAAAVDPMVALRTE